MQIELELLFFRIELKNVDICQRTSFVLVADVDESIALVYPGAMFLDQEFASGQCQ